MNNKKRGKTSRALKALLERKRLNRKDFDNESLHSWISDLRNKRFIPVESMKTHDSTCDYLMLPEEIARYRNPQLRKQQRAEMKAFVEARRKKQMLMKLEQANAIREEEKR